MIGNEEEASSTFVRQRRDLFLISSLLLIAQVADINVEKLSLIGIDLKVEKAPALYAALWALWLYWFLRCYVAFRSIRGTPLWTSYRGELATCLNLAIHRAARRHAEEVMERSPEFRVGHPDFASNVAHGPLTLWTATISGNPTIRSSDGNTHQLPSLTVTIGPLRLWWMRLLALTTLCVSRIEGTEYLFPFVYGLAPAVYWLWANYDCL